MSLDLSPRKLRGGPQGTAGSTGQRLPARPEVLSMGQRRRCLRKGIEEAPQPTCPGHRQGTEDPASLSAVSPRHRHASHVTSIAAPIVTSSQQSLRRLEGRTSLPPALPRSEGNPRRCVGRPQAQTQAHPGPPGSQGKACPAKEGFGPPIPLGVGGGGHSLTPQALAGTAVRGPSPPRGTCWGLHGRQRQCPKFQPSSPEGAAREAGMCGPPVTVSGRGLPGPVFRWRGFPIRHKPGDSALRPSPTLLGGRGLCFDINSRLQQSRCRSLLQI